MPDVTYRIIITDESGGGKASTTATTPSGDESKPTGRRQKTPFEKVVKKYASIGMARNVVNTLARNEINRVELRTGSQALQDRISFAYDTVNSLADSAMTIAAGASMGGVVGAGAAAVYTVATKTVSLLNASTNQKISRSIESIGINQTNIRAGANGNRGGRDED